MTALLNTGSLIMAVVFAIIAIISYNSSFLMDNERAYMGFVNLGIAVCNLLIIYRGFNTVLYPDIILSVTIVLIILLIMGVILIHHTHKSIREHTRDAHDAIEDSPEIKNQLDKYSQKLKKSHHSSLTLSPKLSKKIDEATKNHRSNRKHNSRR